MSDNPVSFNQYLRLVPLALEDRADHRAGQAYYNVLYSINPGLAASVDETPLDPYYDDSKIPAFLAHVCQHWDG